MRRRAWLAVALALAPGLMGALGGDASPATGLVALACATGVALLVVAAARPGSAWQRIAWLVGSGALAGLVVLSSPAPVYLASQSPLRRAVVAGAAIVAAACVALVLGPRPEPRD